MTRPHRLAWLTLTGALALAQAAPSAAQSTTFSYVYDALGRLSSAKVSGSQIRSTIYAYDPADNRISRDSSGSSFRFFPVPLGGVRLIILP